MFSLMKRKPSGASLFENGPLMSFRKEMDDLMENFFGEPSRMLCEVPRLDVAETDTAIEIVTDLPGYKPEEIHVDVGEGYLTISGERSAEKKEEDERKKYHRVERTSGSFSRSVWLPSAVDESKINADLKDGVLTVKLQKTPAAQRKQIPVKG